MVKRYIQYTAVQCCVMLYTQAERGLLSSEKDDEKRRRRKRTTHNKDSSSVLSGVFALAFDKEPHTAHEYARPLSRTFRLSLNCERESRTEDLSV